VPEHTRILVRDAISQIRDIVNNLDPKALQKDKTLTQIAVLIELIVSERRVAFKNETVSIESQFSVDAYHLFVETIPTEMKRVITNLINNAVEALPADKKGNVTILLEKENDFAVIRVQDNGAGMPESLLSTILDNPTTTKEKGSGLGLSHAKKTVEQFGGKIELQSIIGKGTTVSLFMPIHQPPFWFLEKLSIQTDDKIICVDDSVSIWNMWQERFKLLRDSIQLEYCANKDALLRVLSSEPRERCIYLVDYEFSGQKYNGIDLIKRILKHKKPNDQVFLATSRFDEKEVVEFCQEERIKIIPKFYASIINIERIQ
jgi:two-component sensor histidine kinase